jgi:hypothetical protein
MTITQPSFTVGEAVTYTGDELGDLTGTVERINHDGQVLVRWPGGIVEWVHPWDLGKGVPNTQTPVQQVQASTTQCPAWCEQQHEPGGCEWDHEFGDAPIRFHRLAGNWPGWPQLGVIQTEEAGAPTQPAKVTIEAISVPPSDALDIAAELQRLAGIAVATPKANPVSEAKNVSADLAEPDESPAIQALRAQIAAETDPDARHKFARALVALADAEEAAEVKKAVGLPLTPCPAWCDRDACGHWQLSKSEPRTYYRIHHTPPGAVHQVWIEAYEEYGQAIEAPGIQVVPDGSAYGLDDLTPAQARDLATELLRVADIAGGHQPDRRSWPLPKPPAWATEVEDVDGGWIHYSTETINQSWVRCTFRLVLDDANGDLGCSLVRTPDEFVTYLIEDHLSEPREEFTLDEARTIAAGGTIEGVDVEKLAPARAAFAELLAIYDAGREGSEN